MAAMNALRIEANGEQYQVARGVQPITYRFGPFLLDSGRRMLFSALGTRALPEKVYQVLALLVQANGEMVSKQMFMERVWPEGYTSDANLTQHIFVLRHLLGESAGQNEYIVTVAGKGYRFAKPIESKLGLAMKGACEHCLMSLGVGSVAMICSYECTFCEICARRVELRCPNCGGELVQRPRRKS
ncbi:MAG: DUF1272 domain-containing protein [Candidatus Eremiobacteraeota bacterium]|nr:DUF1272 domain-containing protein [Candidatus Eremiobacteraeota bacterium]